MITLYLSPGSSSMAPHIALHEIGVDFEGIWTAAGGHGRELPLADWFVAG